MNYTDDVNGCVIGAVTFPYEFWTLDGKRRIDRGFFENDSEAEAWIKEKYPAEYKQGIDMRCFDQGDK
jgi:hypothetical protein